MAWGTAQKFYSYNRKCQAGIEASITSQNETSVTVNLVGYARSGDGSGYYYASDYGVAVTLYSKLGSADRVNRGSASGTLNYGNVVGRKEVSFTVAKAASAQTLALTVEAASTSGDWPTATASASLTIPALTSYAVTYDANAPSGAGTVTNMPSNQTKLYGQSLTLAANAPSLELYWFDGWNTAADGSGTAYGPSDTYSGNAALALYAQWVLAYAPPTVSVPTVLRTNSSGTAADDGTYATATFEWSVDATADDGGNVGYQAVISSKAVSDTAYTDKATIALSGTGGTVSRTFGTFSADSAYNIRITVTDTHGGSTVRYVTLSSAYIPIDFSPDHGVAIGTAASADLFEVALDAKLDAGFEQENGTVTLDATSKAAWLSALAPDVLYDNATGTNGTVTLSASAANYTHMTIYFRNGDNDHGSVSVYAPNGKQVALFVNHSGYNNQATYIVSRMVAISGTSIATASLNRYSTIAVEPAITAKHENSVYIYRVEAW